MNSYPYSKLQIAPTSNSPWDYGFPITGVELADLISFILHAPVLKDDDGYSTHKRFPFRGPDIVIKLMDDRDCDDEFSYYCRSLEDWITCAEARVIAAVVRYAFMVDGEIDESGRWSLGSRIPGDLMPMIRQLLTTPFRDDGYHKITGFVILKRWDGDECVEDTIIVNEVEDHFTVDNVDDVFLWDERQRPTWVTRPVAHLLMVVARYAQLTLEEAAKEKLDDMSPWDHEEQGNTPLPISHPL